MSGSGGFKVNVSSLIQQSSEWDYEADQMQLIIRKIDGLKDTGIPDGGQLLGLVNDPDSVLFPQFLQHYEDACTYIAMLCGQGQTQMLAVASALIKAADIYQNADRKVAKHAKHALRALRSSEKSKIGHTGRIHELINEETRRTT